jgi:hypothetical protein
VTVTAAAHCIGYCDWTAVGTMADVDRAAERHTRQAKHPTATMAQPAPKTTAATRAAAAQEGTT